MGRPVYESEEDRRNERAVAGRLVAMWNCQVFKNPDFYPLDYSIVQGRMVKGFCEIKCRLAHYETLLLSVHKWMAGLEFTSSTGLPSFIVARSPAGLFRMQIQPMELAIEIAGRKDRGDSQDQEPCVMIPYARMKRIGD
jgi:hypothetical protein